MKPVDEIIQDKIEAGPYCAIGPVPHHLVHWKIHQAFPDNVERRKLVTKLKGYYIVHLRMKINNQVKDEMD